MKVKMKKGSVVSETTLSTFNNFFKRSGWELVDDTAPNIASEEIIEEPVEGNIEEPIEESIEENDEIWEEDEEVTKPLSEMNREELTAYANEHGIDISGLTKNNQIREAIKSAM